MKTLSGKEKIKTEWSIFNILYYLDLNFFYNKLVIKGVKGMQYD